jgi:LacI family transcriptional regulator
MATDKIRIKDIAERAGVSVGTVDRVLHERPNVSKAAREKIEKALAEMDYKPNMYASALAYNKNYHFHLIIPSHLNEAYWDEVEDGAKAATERRRDFGVSLHIMYYERFNGASFSKTARECLKENPDGVIVIPSTLEVTRLFTDQLHEKQIPFILLDSFMPDLKPLAFYGQDSFQSGYFAARMLMLLAKNEKEIMLMKLLKNGQVGSKQQMNRETGFRHYMTDHFPNIKIVEVDLPWDKSDTYESTLESFFKQHPSVHHCITFNSKAHIVGEFLQKSNRREVQIMGYDVVPKNADCVRKGSISFLVAQHAFLQGYACVGTLFDAIVMKKEVTPINYMPIELLTRENIDFYRRENIG